LGTVDGLGVTRAGSSPLSRPLHPSGGPDHVNPLGRHEFDLGLGQGVEEPSPVFAFDGDAICCPDATPGE